MKSRMLTLIFFFVGLFIGAFFCSKHYQHERKQITELVLSENLGKTARNIGYLRDVMRLGGETMFDEVAKVIPTGEFMGVRDCLLLVNQKNNRWEKRISQIDSLFKFEGNTNMADGFGVGINIKYQDSNIVIWSFGKNRQDNDTKFDDLGIILNKENGSVTIRDLNN